VTKRDDESLNFARTVCNRTAELVRLTNAWVSVLQGLSGYGIEWRHEDEGNRIAHDGSSKENKETEVEVSLLWGDDAIPPTLQVVVFPHPADSEKAEECIIYESTDAYQWDVVDDEGKKISTAPTTSHIPRRVAQDLNIKSARY
jgi:hypothetical protein